MPGRIQRSYGAQNKARQNSLKMQMLYFLPVLFQEENVLVMKVAVAIDSFKGGLSSIEAGCAVADGRKRVLPCALSAFDM